MNVTNDDLDIVRDVKGYSTGYCWIDYLSNSEDCFFPEGAITEVMGLKSCSKTTLILEAIAHYYARGGTKKVLYLDFERTVRNQKTYLRNIGFDIDDESKFNYQQPDTFQQGAMYVLNLLRNNGKGEQQTDYAFIVVDTVAAMVPEQEKDNKFGETKQVGLRAKLMNEFCRNITSSLYPEGPAFIFVNQLYEDLSIKGPAAFGPTQYDSSSSNALKYYASFRVSLSLKGKIKDKAVNPFTYEEEENYVGSIIEAMAEKSKIGVPFRKARFIVKYGIGIDAVPTIINAGAKKPEDQPIVRVQGNNALFAIRMGYNEKGEAEYTKNFRGIAQFQKHLYDNPSDLVKIAEQLSPLWKQTAEYVVSTPKYKNGTCSESEESDEEL